MRGYQAQQGREISRCLKELRQLRKDALAECTDEPEAALENEPGSPQPPANDDASSARVAAELAGASEPRETNPTSPAPWPPYFGIERRPSCDMNPR